MAASTLCILCQVFTFEIISILLGMEPYNLDLERVQYNKYIMSYE